MKNTMINTMLRLAFLLIGMGLFCSASAQTQQDNQLNNTASDKVKSDSEMTVFLPNSECEPDPVLDSISIVDGRIYVEDHPITLGEISYVMHKVNPSLYEKQRQGQIMYFSGAVGIFVGVAASCTGYHWMENMPSRERSGKVLLGMGIPVTACSAAMFVWGIRKAKSARKTFKRDCLGIGLEDRLNVGVGLNAASVCFTF